MTLQHTTFEQFQYLAAKAQGRRVVVSRELYGDCLTPARVFQIISGGCDEAVLLDSSDHPTSADACVYIGVHPVARFSSLGHHIRLWEGEEEQSFQGDAFQALQDFFERNRCDSIDPLGKFAGGMIGFLSYDAIRLFEAIPDRHPNLDQIPDLLFTCYGTHVVFDKRSGKVLLSQLVEPPHQPNDQQAYRTAMHGLDHWMQRMQSAALPSTSTPPSTRARSTTSTVTTDTEDPAYCTLVNKAKAYIAQGDAFQIVPSRCFRLPYTGNDFDIYRALRLLNPSPYQFYIRHPQFTLVGSSPERLVSLQHGVVEVMPIAGTRPRGSDFETDQHLEQELTQDEKERAEHIMLVDLARNDVGKVAQPSTVQVVDLAQIQKYSRVMHIVSRVQGQLDHNQNAFDVLRACFPAGTLTGAPKIRAMEIIDEIEPSRRGTYGGAIVAIDNQKQMDACITIRAAFIKAGVAQVRAGGGVVLDSDPQKEADETRHKAQAVLDAIALAQEGFI